MQLNLHTLSAYVICQVHLYVLFLEYPPLLLGIKIYYFHTFNHDNVDHNNNECLNVESNLL